MDKLLVLFKCIVLICFLTSCKMDPADSPDKAAVVESMARSLSQKNPEVAQVFPAELKQWKTSEYHHLVLVDVRRKEKRSISQIPQSISLADFEKQIDQLLEKSGETSLQIVFYDTIGIRSFEMWQRWRERLQDTSLADKIYSLHGGILGWVHAEGELIGPEGIETWRVHVGSEAWNLLPSTHQEVL